MHPLVIALIVLASLAILGVVVILALNRYVNDWRVPRVGKKVGFDKEDRIMYIVAHPDDEVLLSGTLSYLRHKRNLPVKALYLTHGEDGPTNNLVPKWGLKQRRTEELEAVKSILNLTEMTICDYPDRYLSKESFDNVAERVKREVSAFKPTYIFTFDENVGMYGHADHVMAGRAATRVGLEESSVKGIFQMTLPVNMIRLAMKISPTFKKNYDSTSGLPKPNVKFGIYHYRNYRFEVTKAHKTQAQVMSELQPYYDKMPPFVYYAIFNCEYFRYLGK